MATRICKCEKCCPKKAAQLEIERISRTDTAQTAITFFILKPKIDEMLAKICNACGNRQQRLIRDAKAKCR